VRSLSRDPNPLLLKVTARQWWWEVQYEEGGPSEFVTDANEIHLPVGRTVAIDLHSPDVIHSFWVPNLHGKRDMIPGHPTRIFLRADEPGTYWGQCAEFCGYEHAKMRFAVIVEPPDQFKSWLEAQRKPAAPPQSDSERRGQQVFLGTTCIMCHTIQGTPARGTVGPNLTHIASRTRLAAGTLPNTRGHLAGWVADPQRIKPGVRMPMNPLSPEELRTLLDYLESLK
jgi:cytochrome c oxidase subunit 2